MLKKRFWALLLVGCLILSGCVGDSPTDLVEPSLLEVAIPTSAPTPEETPQPTTGSVGDAHTETSAVSESAQITTVSWKAISCGEGFFDLFILVNGKNHYVGNFFGANGFSPCMFGAYEATNAPEHILTHFSGIWTGAGSDFYIMRKSDTKLAVMYHDIPYKGPPRTWENYTEVLVIPIEKNSKVLIAEPTVFRGIPLFEDAIG